jgi:hypothetical protein
LTVIGDGKWDMCGATFSATIMHKTRIGNGC